MRLSSFAPSTFFKKPRQDLLKSILDFFGLIISCFIIQQVYHQTISMLILLLISIILWLIMRYLFAQPVYLSKNTYHILILPLLASLSAFFTLNLVGVDYSVDTSILFIGLWTFFLGSHRFLFDSYYSSIPLAVIEPRIAKSLQVFPNIQPTLLKVPSKFEKWDAILIDSRVSYNQEWLIWLLNAQKMNIPVIDAPDVLEHLNGYLSLEMIEKQNIENQLHPKHSYVILKRYLDIAVTLLLIPILIPLLLLTGLLVYFSCGRPVIFRQQRIGRNGKAFTMYKFRSMRHDSENKGAQFTTPNDARITLVGKFIRKYRLDELPQFWNVLKGDMSIIGPRPEQEAFVKGFSELIPFYDLRHRVLPGITGWAQTHHGYAAGANETLVKLRYDLYYIKHYSLLLDLKIFFKTLLTILTGFGSR